MRRVVLTREGEDGRPRKGNAKIGPNRNADNELYNLKCTYLTKLSQLIPRFVSPSASFLTLTHGVLLKLKRASFLLIIKRGCHPGRSEAYSIDSRLFV